MSLLGWSCETDCRLRFSSGSSFAMCTFYLSNPSFSSVVGIQYRCVAVSGSRNARQGDVLLSVLEQPAVDVTFSPSLLFLSPHNSQKHTLHILPSQF